MKGEFFRSGSASVHADPDPGGISLCRSGSETLIFTIRIRSALPYRIDMQNAMYIYTNTDWRIFRTRKRSHACVGYTMVKSVLLRWMIEANLRTSTAVKSGSGISVGPSLKPHILS